MSPKYWVTSLLIVLFFLWPVRELIAQNASLFDSLKSELQQENEEAVRIEILKRLSFTASSPTDKIYYSEELIKSAEKLGNMSYLSRGYQKKGTGLKKLGNINEALESLFKAAEIAKQEGLLEELGMAYIEIASAFRSTNEPENALNYSIKAIQILRSSGSSQHLATNLLNTGFQYYTLNNYDSALAYYEEAEDIFVEIDLTIGIAYSIGNRALVKWKMGQIKQAIKDLHTAIELLKPIGDEYGMADYHNQLGNIYYDHGDRENSAYHLSQGVRIAYKLDLKEQIRDASKMLSKIYHDGGETDSAYHYLSQYLSARDSIANEETIKALANQRADYEISLKQAEVDLANVQKRNRQFLAIGLGAVVVLISIFLVFVYIAYQKRKKLSLELQALNATKDKFFSIVSHDLRGPIGAFNGVGNLIKGFLKKKAYDDLEQMTDLIDKSANSLSELLDNLLSWAVQQQGQVPINRVPLDVNKIVETTLEIFESSAMAKDIVLANELNRSVFILADKDAVMTIFRNLVGNALKFTPSGGKIWVEAETEEGMVQVRVSDTGIGMSEEQMAKLFSMREKRSYGTQGETGLGVGLQLVNEFVALNGGKIEVESKEQEGSTFIVSLPVPNVAELKVASEQTA